MYPVSAELIAKVESGSHTRQVKVETVNLATLAVVTDISAKVVDGNISLQANEEGRRTCSLVVANPDGVYTPKTTSDPSVPARERERTRR